MKNFLIYLSVFIIIALSLKMPEFLFYLQNQNNGMVINVKKNDSKIDVEAQNIYLVKLIHETQDGYATVKIANSVQYVNLPENPETEEKDFVTQEFEKLAVYGVFKPLNKIEDFSEKYSKYSAVAINRVYNRDNKEYFVTDLSLEGDAFKYTSFQVENKTKKILSLLGFDKEFFADLDKEQIMRNFVKYLDLHIIDDWKFENNYLKSEKAGLQVYLHEYFSTTNSIPKCSLSIRSSINDIVNGNTIYTSATE